MAIIPKGSIKEFRKMYPDYLLPRWQSAILISLAIIGFIIPVVCVILNFMKG